MIISLIFSPFDCSASGLTMKFVISVETSWFDQFQQPYETLKSSNKEALILFKGMVVG